MTDSTPEEPHEHDGVARWAEGTLGCALLAGTAAVVLFSRGTDVAERLATWPWTGWWHGLLALPPVAFIVGAAARRPVPRLGAALDLGLFLWAFAAVAGAWFAVSRPAAMNAAVLPFSAICLAYVVRGWLGFDPVISRMRAHRVLTVVSVAISTILATAWWELGSASSEHGSEAVGLAAMAVPLFGGMATALRGTWRVAWVLAALAALAFVATIGGLAGACALGALLSCCGLALVATRRSPRLGWACAVAGVLMLFALCLGAWTPDRAATDAPTLEARERTALIKLGAAIGVDRPLLGQGPGMVAWLFPNYAARFSVVADAIAAVPSAPVQVWAEHGALGLLALISLVLGVGLRAWRLRPGGVAADAGTHEDRMRAWAVVCALAAGAGFALVEYPLNAPAFLAVGAALLPVLSALTRPVSDTRVSWSPTFVRVTPAAAVAAATILLGWHLWPDLKAHRDFAVAVAAREHGDSERFIASVRRARERARWDPAYPDALARFFAREEEEAGDVPRTRAVRGMAIGLFRQAIAARPGQIDSRLNLGALLLATGDSDAAAVEFGAAASLAPNRADIHHQWGTALLRGGRVAEAVNAFALGWVIAPRSSTRAAWTEPELEEIRGNVAAAAVTQLAFLARDGRPGVAEIAGRLARELAQGEATDLPPDGWLPARERRRLTLVP